MNIGTLESWYNFDILTGTYSISSDMGIVTEGVGASIKQFGSWLKDKLVKMWNRFITFVKDALNKIQSKKKMLRLKKKLQIIQLLKIERKKMMKNMQMNTLQHLNMYVGH